MANSIGEWIKRYGLWCLVLGVGILVVMAKLFPTAKRGPLKILKQAEDRANQLHTEKSKELEKLDIRFEANTTELIEIIEIEDEEDRLKQLAAFANRRRQR